MLAVAVVLAIKKMRPIGEPDNGVEEVSGEEETVLLINLIVIRTQ